MIYEFDGALGRAVGSVIQMGVTFLGLKPFASEVVTVRTTLTSKRWVTRGPQRMLVIDSYVMGLETRPSGVGSGVRVFIDYQLPHGLSGRMLGLLFAPFYARWCVSRMVRDVSRHFGAAAEPGIAA